MQEIRVCSRWNDCESGQIRLRSDCVDMIPFAKYLDQRTQREGTTSVHRPWGRFKGGIVAGVTLFMEVLATTSGTFHCCDG